jgi:hypothetical protein
VFVDMHDFGFCISSETTEVWESPICSNLEEIHAGPEVIFNSQGKEISLQGRISLCPSSFPSSAMI